jgi:hypothetical protein
MRKPSKIITLVLTITAIFTACGSPSVDNSNLQTTTNVSYHVEDPIIETEPFTDEEVDAIAKTLAENVMTTN